MTTDVAVPMAVEEGASSPWPHKEEFGTVRLNVKGALASGEAERIAEYLLKWDGEITASTFAMTAYGTDVFAKHQAASSTLGHLVKKGVLKRKSAGRFIKGDGKKKVEDKPKRKYTRKPKVEAALTVGDVLEVVGFWNGKTVLRNLDTPEKLIVVGDVS